MLNFINQIYFISDGNGSVSLPATPTRVRQPPGQLIHYLNFM